MKLKFKVGDKVKTAPNGSDVVYIQATWNAIITKVIGENDEGGCYETVGKWEPLVDENGNVDDFWSDHDPNTEPKSRQLYGYHLVKVEE